MTQHEQNIHRHHNRSATTLSRPRATAHDSGFSVVKGLLWGTAFLVTAIASATLGTVVGFTLPASEQAVQGDDSESSSPSIIELWRKGIRHDITRPVNILVMGIDEVSPLERDPALDQSGSLSGRSEQSTASETSGTPGTAESSSNGDESSPTQDLSQFSGRSDTMLLVQINPDTNAVSILSIPRDTQVEFPNRLGVTKINHANLLGGPKLAANVVSMNLHGVEIDRYVRVDTSAFRDVVDALGGVEVTVPKPMKYTDQTQGLYIDLEAGRQILTGEQAEQFARFRSDAYGDIGRVQRQQQLLQALRDRVMTPSVLPNIPAVIQILRSHIDTNLTPEELLALVNFSLGLDRENFRMVMLPGTFSQANDYIASYWLMDQPAVTQVMKTYFGVTPPRLGSSFGREENGDRTEQPDVTTLRIAIQNASTDPAASRKMIRALRDQGFTNTYITAPLSETQLETQIIVQRGNLDAAKQLEQSLPHGTIVSASTGDLYSDLTIRIGEDWGSVPEDLGGN